jgi:hypothetical protein
VKTFTLNRFLCWSALLASGLATAAGDTFVVNSEDRLRIEQAVPDKPIVVPAKPRRLLIFTLNVGYGGHPSIAYANEAFTLMGKRTGAFETFVSADPTVFGRESLSSSMRFSSIIRLAIASPTRTCGRI